MYSLTEKSNSMFIIITQWPFFIALVPTKQMRQIMLNQRWDI